LGLPVHQTPINAYQAAVPENNLPKPGVGELDQAEVAPGYCAGIETTMIKDGFTQVAANKGATLEVDTFYGLFSGVQGFKAPIGIDCLFKHWHENRPLKL
jgi:hypothetical protein